MKKVIIFNLFFILCLLFIFTTDSFADGLAIKQYFIDSNSTLEFESISSTIYTILMSIGMLLAVCIMAVIAISYMVATPAKRAMLKERLVFYVAGVIFLLAGVGFLGWYANLANRVKDTVSSGTTSTYSYSTTTGPQLSEEAIRNLSQPETDFKNRVSGSGGRYTY